MAVQLSVALLPDLPIAGATRKFYKVGKFMQPVKLRVTVAST